MLITNKSEQCLCWTLWRLAVLILVMAATAVNAFWHFNSWGEYESRDLMDDIEFIMEKNEKPNCVTCGKIEKCRWHWIKLTKEEEIELLKEYIRENYIGCIGLNSYDDGTYESRRFVGFIKRLELLTGNRYIHEELRDEVDITALTKPLLLLGDRSTVSFTAAYSGILSR